MEVLVDGAERYLALKGQGILQRAGNGIAFDAGAFALLPEEIRLRLLMRAINRLGHEGPAELGKAETLLAQLDRSFTERPGQVRSTPPRARLRQTLAGALVSLEQGRLHIEPAPLRRRQHR